MRKNAVAMILLSAALPFAVQAAPADAAAKAASRQVASAADDKVQEKAAALGALAPASGGEAKRTSPRPPADPLDYTNMMLRDRNLYNY